MNLLVIYDVSGIQEFIFSSKKLKENIGASIMVRNVLNEILLETSRDLFGHQSTKMEEDVKFIQIDSLKAEVIYVGGGNALMLFRGMEEFMSFNEKFSKEVIKYSDGKLSIICAYVETELIDFHVDYEKLRQKIEKEKRNKILKDRWGYAITKEGVSDNLPAYDKYDGDCLSRSAILKRKIAVGKKIHSDIDEFSGKEGEQYVAIIHIDGNNMGKQIEKYISGYNDFGTALSKIRFMSNEITKIYNEAIKKTKKYIDNLISDERAINKLGVDNKTEPYRIIINDGDDITLIINGKLAISFTENLLKNIDGKEIGDANNKVVLSACAGIAYVKPHFPFYTAYSIAEQLCSTAKKKAKKINSDYSVGSWFDFHIQQGGSSVNLHEFRDKYYNVPGMEKASIFNLSDGWPEYNLLWRPFCVTEQSTQYFNWNIYKDKVISWFRRIPVTKYKSLRNQIKKSKEDGEIEVKFMKTRGYNLPKYGGSNELYFTLDGRATNITPYYDAIEIIDYVVDSEGGSK